ncbi:peroxide stress protein YaaA [Quatrionicoccus australiensis]|uniref:peroxide stress protein YaaA n=1 Tax=Quatrionicoccus australiensis TaxID=138118 RepID=UPI001CFA7CD4|nr:peroxide stress protein YaaA [Quatrionicoccus australiensis]MCB4361472.1 peroxide stress protein YaaA [Quatrionicoccus australiensis]
MLIFLSPAKSLDYKTPPHVATHSLPAYLKQSETLIKQLRKLSPADIANLMDLSDPLALLNFNRYADWSLPFSPDNAKQAVLAFDGDVYDGLSAKTLSADDLDFAQSQVRILSGLYGILKPLDLIQPYRLEMGTKFANKAGKDLYAFWGETLLDAINAELDAMPHPVAVNLASEEYFKAAVGRKIKGQLIQPVFEDWKGGRYKIISFYAKRARGLMTRYAVLNRLTDPEGLKDFDSDGYAYVPEASDDKSWVFRRRQE